MERPNTVITVTGESIPNLKKGAYRDAENIYATTPDLKYYIENWNRSDRIIYFKNGSIIEFVSNLTEQSAKNGKRDYLFVNEANGISWAIFFQLAIRTRKQIYIDYNPTVPFWAHDMLIGTDPTTNELSATVKLIISDHRHNVFLTEEEHMKIEGIKDPGLWRVYARGYTGNITGLIYPTWKRIPDEQFDRMTREETFFGGLDFGYTNDPTAGTKLWRIAGAIYIKQLCYEPGIAAKHLKGIFEQAGFDHTKPVYCENDKDMGRQLREVGGANWLPARKGQGSINAGIEKMKEYDVFYAASSADLHEEVKRYIWINDKDTGKPTNTPIDSYNHLLDSVRYGVYSHYYRVK
jgi:phage terminase large subunit